MKRHSRPPSGGVFRYRWWVRVRVRVRVCVCVGGGGSGKQTGGENTSSFESTGEPASSPCGRKGDEDDREAREREDLRLVEEDRLTEQSQPGWRLRNVCGWVERLDRPRRDIYDVLRGANLIGEKSGEKQPRRRKEAPLLAERERETRSDASTLRDFGFCSRNACFSFSNEPIQFGFNGLSQVLPWPPKSWWVLKRSLELPPRLGYVPAPDRWTGPGPGPVRGPRPGCPPGPGLLWTGTACGCWSFAGTADPCCRPGSRLGTRSGWEGDVSNLGAVDWAPFSVWTRAWDLTSVGASGQHVPLAHGPFELRSRPVDQSTGLSGLRLGPPAVAELGANHQETFWRRLRGNQPTGSLG